MTFRDADFVVPERAPLRPLDRVLREFHPGSSWNAVRRLIETGKVQVEGKTVRDNIFAVPPGCTVSLRMTSRRVSEAPIPRESIVHVDAHLVVVRKPAGISTVPHGDEQDTLDRVTHQLLRKLAHRGMTVPPLGVVQRLDRDTTGLIVFARTSSAKTHLQQQFRVHSVHRRYLALAHGHVESQVFRSRLVEDRGDGYRGSTANPKLGREAITHVRALSKFKGATFIECRLETGRTHQIRIHLSEAGHPLVGERVYEKRYRGQLMVAPRIMLHAAELGFVHPATGEELRFSEPLPADMELLLDTLRRGG